MIRLIDAVDILVEYALLRGEQRPVITTDFRTACELIHLIEKDAGMHSGELVRASAPKPGVVGMYNGVEFRYPTDPVRQGWQEHFGPLAEIWGQA